MMMRAKPYGLAKELCMVSCEAHHLPRIFREKSVSESVKKRGLKAPFLLSMLKELGDCHEAFCRAGKGKA